MTHVARVALLCLTLFATASHAQAQTFEGVELDLLEPTPFADAGVVTDTAQRYEQWGYSAQLTVHYALNPLVWRYPNNSVSLAVSHTLYMYVMGHVAVLPWLSIGGGLPVELLFTPVDLRGIAPAPGAGVGDLKLSVKATFLDQYRHFLNLGIAVDFSLPTSGGKAYLGSTTVGAYPRLVVSRRFSIVEVALNFGARLRVGREVAGSMVASQLAYNVMLRLLLPWRAGPTSYEIAAELWGLTSAVRPFAREGENVVEWLASLRVGLFDNFYMTASVGGGLIAGYGSPDMRAMLGLAWAPREMDRDGDGIVDRKDSCPDQAETMNGIDDWDGCPEADRDRDGIPDIVDKCPDRRETRNGYKDEDGCPDKRPKKCKPLVVYDADENDEPDEKPADDEACPEPPPPPPPKDAPPPKDRDRDGVSDTDDKCPDEPENINGNNDDDGCPDEGQGVTVFVSKQKINILEKINFETASAVIKPESFTILDQVSQQLRAHPEVKTLRIEGHTDSVGADDYNMRLSQARAESVKKYLTEKGRIAPERLIAKGYGETRPIASNTTPRGKAQNRRVEFLIVEQDEPK